MATMKKRAVSWIGVMVASATSAFGCQLLYEKNDLTVGTGGGGAATTSTTASSGGAGGATTTETAMGGTTTSAGGTGGAGGATTTGGAGGAGGATTSTGGAGGAGGTGGTGGSTTSTTTTTPTCEDPLFVLATGDAGLLCAAYAPASGWTSTPKANGSSTARPAAVFVDGQTGVGVFYQGAASGPLRAVELAVGAGDACGDPADVLTVTTKAAPSVAVLNGQARALFQGAVGAGTDHPFVAAWDPVTKWAAPAQIDMNVFSATVAGLATSGTSMLAVYGGGDDNLYRVRFAGAAWQLPATCFKDAMSNCEQANKAITPAVTGLDAGGWLVVFQEKAAPTELRWLTGDGAMNVASQKIAGAASSSPVAVARVNGGAVLGFRGTDGKVYAAVYESAGGVWGAVTQIGAGTTSTSPAVSAGSCSHRAELVYVDAVDGSIRHASLENGTWSAPVMVGGAGMKGVAIAAVP